jgi:hypothetical protein
MQDLQGVLQAANRCLEQNTGWPSSVMGSADFGQPMSLQQQQFQQQVMGAAGSHLLQEETTDELEEAKSSAFDVPRKEVSDRWKERSAEIQQRTKHRDHRERRSDRRGGRNTVPKCEANSFDKFCQSHTPQKVDQQQGGVQLLRFLPMAVRGVPVLSRQGQNTYRVNNALLKSDLAGVSYRVSKDLAAKDGDLALWGQCVCGVDDGDGWLREI